MALSSPSQKIAVVSFALFTVLAGGLAAEPIRSLSDSEIEYAESRMALDKAIEENQQLREKLIVAEAAAARMTQSLAVANSEAEIFRRQAGELMLRFEALGADAAGGNANQLEQRLLSAVRDLRVAEEERKELSAALASLQSATSEFARKVPNADPTARLTLEAAMRQAAEAMGQGAPASIEAMAAAPTLTEGMVISIKDELALVVANIGAKHGVKVGMPFQVLRQDNLVATVRVVDVRDRIAGAVIQNLSSDRSKIQVGDRLKVDARQ